VRLTGYDDPINDMVTLVGHLVSDGRFDDYYGRIQAPDGRCTLIGKRLFFETEEGDHLTRYSSPSEARAAFEEWVDDYNRNPANDTPSYLNLLATMQRAWDRWKERAA